MSSRSRFIVFFAAIAMASGDLPARGSPGVAPANQLVVGTVSDKPGRNIDRFAGIAELLAKGPKFAGARTRFTESIREMIALISSGEIHVYMDSLLGILLARAETGCHIAALRLKSGVASYRAVLYGLKPAPAVGDAKTFAFEEPFSTSGFFVPLVAVHASGRKPRRVDDLSEPGKGPRYAFSWSDETTGYWIATGRSELGATDEKTFAEHDALNPGLFEVVWRSSPIPRQLVCLAPQLSLGQRRGLTERLLAMHNTEAGQQALQAFKTKSFDPVPPKLLNGIARWQDDIVDFLAATRGKSP